MTDKTEPGAATAPKPEHWDFPPGTVLGHFEQRGNRYAGWRDFLVDVVTHDFEQSAAYAALKTRYDEIEQRLAAEATHETALASHFLFWEFYNDAIDHAARLGYALARTAPAGPEGLSGVGFSS